jgi:hypothetical protein
VHPHRPVKELRVAHLEVGKNARSERLGSPRYVFQGSRACCGSILEIVHSNSRCGLFLGLEERVRAFIGKLAGLPHFPESPAIGMEFDRKAAGRSAHHVGEDGLAIEMWSDVPLADKDFAHLGLGRAYAMQGDTAKARAKYQDSLTLWNNADSDIFILKQAKAEYAKLH